MDFFMERKFEKMIDSLEMSVRLRFKGKNPLALFAFQDLSMNIIRS